MKSLIAVLCLALCSTQLLAQLPEFPKPTKEHEWLQQFVGEWESTSEATTGPGQPTQTCTGTMKAKMLGGFWLIGEVESNMPGMKIQAVQTIGYDPEKKKYIGSWVDSAFNHQWKYEGSVDETGKILTLQAEGPSFAEPGKTAQFRDIYEFKSKDHIVATSQMQIEGVWVTFMTGQVTRSKK